MDKKNLEFLSKNSKEFFGKERTAEQILDAEWYKSIVNEYHPKPGEDKKYSSTFKCKVGIWKGKASFVAYDAATAKEIVVSTEIMDAFGKPVLDKDGDKTYKTNWDFFERGFDAESIIHQGSLQIINKKAYFSWKLSGVKMFKSVIDNKVTFNSFGDDDEPADEVATGAGAGVGAGAEGNDEGAEGEGEGSNELVVSEDDD